MDWEALAAIASIAVAGGTLLAVIWRGGQMSQTQVQHGREIGELKERQQAHADLHSASGARLSAVDAKLDLILGQQGRMIEKIDRLAEKDH